MKDETQAPDADATSPLSQRERAGVRENAPAAPPSPLDPRPSAPPAAVPWAEQIAAHLRRKSALGLAHAKSLPGPLRRAFAEPRRAVCGHSLRQPEMGDIPLLTSMRNPLLTALEHWLAGPAAPEEELFITGADAADALHLWELSFDDAAIFWRSDGAAFRAVSVNRMEAVPGPATLEELARGLYAHLRGAFDTFFDLRLRQSDGNVTYTSGTEPDGIGWWLATMTVLVSQLGFTWDAAQRLPLSQALALTAAHRWMAGTHEFSGDGPVALEAGEMIKNSGTQESETTEGSPLPDFLSS